MIYACDLCGLRSEDEVPRHVTLHDCVRALKAEVARQKLIARANGEYLERLKHRVPRVADPNREGWCAHGRSLKAWCGTCADLVLGPSE